VDLCVRSSCRRRSRNSVHGGGGGDDTDVQNIQR